MGFLIFTAIFLGGLYLIAKLATAAAWLFTGICIVYIAVSLVRRH